MNPFTFAELFTKVAETDSSTLWLTVLIAFVATYNIRDYMANPVFAVLLMPMIVGLSLVFAAAFQMFEFFSFFRYDQWLMAVVLATASGASVTIVIAAILGRVSETFQPDRNLDDDPSATPAPASAAPQA